MRMASKDFFSIINEENKVCGISLGSDSISEHMFGWDKLAELMKSHLTSDKIRIAEVPSTFFDQMRYCEFDEIDRRRRQAQRKFGTSKKDVFVWFSTRSDNPPAGSHADNVCQIVGHNDLATSWSEDGFALRARDTKSIEALTIVYAAALRGDLGVCRISDIVDLEEDYGDDYIINTDSPVLYIKSAYYVDDGKRTRKLYRAGAKDNIIFLGAMNIGKPRSSQKPPAAILI